ncbi:hypothetical protein [Clostridium oceanicum]|uniref:Uncharacterized protein n=1 Tax=Clostridium oceanicum TaxID=1543 RepID=A0ABP3UMY8_9CLOT
MKRVYRDFSSFVEQSVAKRINFLVSDATFKTTFEDRVKKMIEDVKKKKNEEIDLVILFNTEGNIAIIDEYIISKFITNNYINLIRMYYRVGQTNKVIKDIVNSNNSVKENFLITSYKTIYNSIIKIYEDMTCRRDVIMRYKIKYQLLDYNKEDISAIVITIMIMEDICKCIGLKKRSLLDIIKKFTKKKQ